MSKAKKVAIIVAISMIVVGILTMTAAALMSGFDLTNLTSQDIQTKTFEIKESFSKIEINSIDCDVEIMPVSDGRCKVVYKGMEKMLDTVEVKDDKLFIKQVDRRKWYEYISFGWIDENAITVYLPEEEYQSLLLKTVSGDISVSNDFTFYCAETMSTSGDVSFLANVEDNLRIKSTSGKIRVKNIADGKVEVITTSGDVFMTEGTPYQLKIKTTSGDVKISSVISEDAAMIESMSGDIRMERSDAGSFHMKTTSGDISGSILSRKDFDVETASGDIRLPKSDSSAPKCEISTSSGDVEMEIIS